MAEKPWFPGPDGSPYTVILINPQGDRHLTFDTAQGQWYRLWQGREPEKLTAGQAVMLRPSDVDLITRYSIIWIAGHGIDGHGGELSNELAAGIKRVVLHYASAAGAG